MQWNNVLFQESLDLFSHSVALQILWHRMNSLLMKVNISLIKKSCQYFTKYFPPQRGRHKKTEVTDYLRVFKDKIPTTFNEITEEKIEDILSENSNQILFLACYSICQSCNVKSYFAILKVNFNFRTNIITTKNKEREREREEQCLLFNFYTFTLDTNDNKCQVGSYKYSNIIQMETDN